MGKKQTCFHCKTIFEIFFNVFNVNKLFPGIMIFGAKRSKAPDRVAKTNLNNILNICSTREIKLSMILYVILQKVCFSYH